MDKEEKKALDELLKKIPEEELTKAVGGLTPSQRRTLLIVGGCIAAAVSAVGLHEFIRYRRKKSRDKEQAAGLIGGVPNGSDEPSYEVADDDMKFEERTEEECLIWMQKNKLRSDNAKGWNEDTVAAYIAWGGKMGLLPGLVQSNLEKWKFE